MAVRDGSGISRESSRNYSRDGMELHDFLGAQDETGNDPGRRE